MTTGYDAIDQHNQHNHMDNGGDEFLLSLYGFTQHDDNTLVADVVDGITQHGDHNQITNEGGVERRDRGNNMGRCLQRLNRACRGKLQVVITEGNIRPVVPLVAAKFATECNIIVRNHVPILPHWKLYKEKPASAYVNLFLGKLKAKFDINIEDDTVKMACTEMMKSAVRQQRYRLKQKYFDPFPLHLVTKTSPVKFMSNEQWTQLLESWKSPQKMEMCQKNKENRGNVKYHHTTGSRAYMVHVENLTRMENKLSTTTEGEELKSAAQVVADVLAENTKKNRFLKNVGFHNAQPRFSEQSTETELEAEKRTNAELRAQVADLSNKVQESEQARIKDREEMKRSQSEMEAKLNLLLSQIRPS
uniref:OSJNBb0061C13.10 protein n=1 Tax=Oryza sativa subsp. japonica TaxID=39947 RepID=Q7XKK9_ORYSJ|nr:OSJNBb0061C13.10 [Oryza sativa Japonica Group]